MLENPAPLPDDVPYDAILFASFGGPEQQEDVVPFLRNVTRGRGIPDERLEVVGEHYRKLGGRSPINDQNRDLIARFQRALAAAGIDLPVYWGNRNWAPFTSDVVGRISADGHRRVLAVATSAYSSYSSCRQYREDYAKALVANDLVGQMEIQKIRAYFDHPGFLEPVRDGVRAAITQMRDAGHDASRTRVLFSTHSIPHVMSSASGPAEKDAQDPSAGDVGGWYVAQHLAACRWVMEQLRATGGASAGARPGDAARADGGAAALGVPDWELVYQSRSGAPHVPWLEPDINDRLQEIRENGEADAVIVVPIGFVTDHVEVVWDLDTEAAETAEELGLAFTRVATSGTDERFVEGLVDLVREHVEPGHSPRAVTDFGVVEDTCGALCCLNGSAHARPVPVEGTPLDTVEQIALAMRADEHMRALITEEQAAHAEQSRAGSEVPA
ncbi:ferrochelatase [Brachybacterium sp. MASK1Z-5]|uniref:Coproporphyrin III ferrochelatase n=1 Tax=Brachybacterium halotolerans TaxID=2795215 RepID=A0ABS1B7X9_9MICO|nr:ferrochelatase [Brachybacterium halotolerans]MBK0330767.1 ferrochelatase [Brachybacterium halotolerans]